MTDTSDRGMRGRGHAREAPGADPFTALGLPTRLGLSDEDVRAAWRRIAAATHPDREDGGDQARFDAAGAAYAELRTEFGRGEALADLGVGDPRAPWRNGRYDSANAMELTSRARGGRHRARRVPPAGRPAGPPRWPGRRAATAGTGAVFRTLTRLHGVTTRRRWRPGRLAMRVATSGVVGLVAFALAGWSPGVVGVIAGLLTWLVAGARRALGRRRSP